MWAGRDEADNYSQKHDAEIIKEEKRIEVENEVRLQVDELMREELKNLKMVRSTSCQSVVSTRSTVVCDKNVHSESGCSSEIVVIFLKNIEEKLLTKLDVKMAVCCLKEKLLPGRRRLLSSSSSSSSASL